jgi:hypothetical protein
MLDGGAGSLFQAINRKRSRRSSLRRDLLGPWQSIRIADARDLLVVPLSRYLEGSLGFPADRRGAPRLASPRPPRTDSPVWRLEEGPE